MSPSMLRELTERMAALFELIAARAESPGARLPAAPKVDEVAHRLVSAWIAATTAASRNEFEHLRTSHDECLRACEALGLLFEIDALPALASDEQYLAKRKRDELAATKRAIALSTADDEFSSMGD